MFSSGAKTISGAFISFKNFILKIFNVLKFYYNVLIFLILSIVQRLRDH